MHYYLNLRIAEFTRVAIQKDSGGWNWSHAHAHAINADLADFLHRLRISFVGAVSVLLDRITAESPYEF